MVRRRISSGRRSRGRSSQSSGRSSQSRGRRSRGRRSRSRSSQSNPKWYYITIPNPEHRTRDIRIRIPSPSRCLQQRPVSSQRSYCGNKSVIPNGYSTRASRYECLKKGIGVGICSVYPRR